MKDCYANRPAHEHRLTQRRPSGTMAAMQPNQPASAALLRATIAQTAPLIPVADNVGQSNDQQDIYYLLDYLCFAVDRAYPQIPCSKGCSHCCKQLFRVTQLEWTTFKQGLAEMPAETRDAILARTIEQFGPHRETLERMAAIWTAGERLPEELPQQTPMGCPMLIDGRCSNYSHRPAICRGYGYFSATINETSFLLICRQEGPSWLNHLESTHVDQFPMPNWNPVQRKLEALNGPAPIKPLPLWLLELAEGADTLPV
jgi:Fe-S-cluster containining protein